MNRTKTKIQNLRGFTLLEVLLAMAILAVILTVVYASFSTAGKNVEQAEALRDEMDIARGLLVRISSDIANSYIGQNMSTTFFYGKKEEAEGESSGGAKIRRDSIAMTTLTNRPLNLKETELWEVGYFFKEKPDGKGFVLFRREKRELSKDVLPLDGGTEDEITDRVESLQFRYSTDGTNWTDNGWPLSSSAQPKAMEIILTLDNGKVYTTKVDVGNRG